jgi:hypothetical protein
MFAFDAAVFGTPLCHFVTSPPQGGRVETHALRHPNSDLLNSIGHAGGVPLSPPVGEMPGRAEGGNTRAAKTEEATP